MSAPKIRELILQADIFAPGATTAGAGALALMRKVPDLLDFSREDVGAELKEMAEAGLIEPWGEDSSEAWKSTRKGRAASEAIARSQGNRAKCLCPPEENLLDDVVLALVASEQVCQGGTPCG